MRDQGVRLSNTEKAKHTKWSMATCSFFIFLIFEVERSAVAHKDRLLSVSWTRRESSFCTVYAEETFGCCGGCAVCGAVKGAVVTGGCCWLRPAGVESCDSWSLFERDFNSAFSRSSVEFFSINSFICSFRTSTSSLTAYIRWLLTRS